MKFLFPIAVFVFPAWVIGYPTFLYIVGRKSGELPSEAEWNSFAHSSGPWSHEFFISYIFIIVAGLAFYFVACFIFGAIRKKQYLIWSASGACATVAMFLISFWKFGYLME